MVTLECFNQPGWRIWIASHCNNLWFIALNSHIVKTNDSSKSCAFSTAVDEVEECGPARGREGWNHRWYRSSVDTCGGSCLGLSSDLTYWLWNVHRFWSPSQFRLATCKIEGKINTYFTICQYVWLFKSQPIKHENNYTVYAYNLHFLWQLWQKKGIERGNIFLRHF